ncbi:hypothetical protein HZA55_01180 [Candidatus Poribacteria bacterium]|nr:hypothetical protein [Candidatus Poribacteria bacterium]
MSKRWFLYTFCLLGIITPDLINAEIDTTKIVPQEIKISSIPSNISLEAKVNMDSIPLNKELVFEITVKWESEADKYQFEIVESPNYKNLSIKGSKVTNQMFPKDGHFEGTKVFTYTFKPEKEGEAFLEPISVSYIDKDTNTPHSLKTPRIAVTIISPTFEFKLDNKFIVYTGISIILAACTFLGIFLYKNNKQQKCFEKIDFPQKSCMEINKENLEKILSSETENIQEQFTQIPNLLKKNLLDKYALNKSCLNTSELLSQINKLDISDEEKKSYKDIFEFCDTIKYAGIGLSDKEEAKVIIDKIKKLI